MSHGLCRFCLLLVTGAFLISLPVLAGTTVTQGGTVFIGEEGLDISATLGTNTSTIAWWASAADISTSSPTVQVTVTSPSNFYVSPAQFSGYTGTWYRINAEGSADGPAFIVADPTLQLRVLDTSISNLDVTDKWVPRGDVVGFRIDTNLNPIFNRGGSANGGITIYVQSPDGAQYSALVDASGATHNMQDLQVTVPSYLTGPVWSTANSQYPAGTYTIWTECNANSIKDNYPVTGKTITARTSLLDQEQNPLISGASTGSQTSAATTTTTKVTTVVTTTPVTTVTTPETTVATPTETITQAVTTQTTAPSNTTPVTPVQTSTKAPGFGLIPAFLALALIGLAFKPGNR
ncbi:MAG: DUF3821 domain-containing protein [Methanoregula sp.]|jgi:hypothetical protein